MASVLGPVLEQLSGPGSLFETVPDTDRGVLTYRNRLLNLRHLVEIGAGHGDLEYVAQGEERLTFADTFDRALRLAAALTERVGISPGDRVAILGGNSPGWVVAFWALVVVQAIVVPLNPWETDRQLDAKRMDTGAKAVLSDRARADLALAVGFTAQEVVVWGGRSGAGSLEELVAAHEPTSLHAVPAAHEDSVAILFGTSGTTGSTQIDGHLAPQRAEQHDDQRVVHRGGPSSFPGPAWPKAPKRRPWWRSLFSTSRRA